MWKKGSITMHVRDLWFHAWAGATEASVAAPRISTQTFSVAELLTGGLPGSCLARREA